MPDKRNFSEAIANESDLLRRMVLISFNMDVLKDPEEAILTYNMPDGYYEQWADAHYRNLIARTAKRTGIDPAILANKESRTKAQYEEILKTSAQDQIARLESFISSNYIAAIKHINSYCESIYEEHGVDNIYHPLAEEVPCEAQESGKLINVPMAATLYYFATHEDIDPRASDNLTAEDKTNLISIFATLDDFYRERRAELHTEYELLKEYIDLLNPKSPALAREKLEHIALKRAEIIEYPLDKVNSHIWSLLERDTAGQIMFRAEKRGSKKELNILYSIDFDALGSNARITKKLTQYDKRVYIAVSALFNAGNSVITLQQIYTAMGGAGRAAVDQREKISAAVHKMSSAMISIDNTMEAGSYNYPKFVYTGSLLPIEQIKEIVNGNLVEEAIHLFREPPAMTFAKQRGQITTIPVRLLNSPVSKTDANLAIEDYLLDRIAHAKKGKGQAKILYRTICEKAQATTTKQKQRVPEKVQRYLSHYSKCGFISSFTAEADGVTVFF